MNRREFVIGAIAAVALPATVAASVVAPRATEFTEALKWRLIPGLWSFSQQYPDFSSDIKATDEGIIVMGWRKEYENWRDDPLALGFFMDQYDHEYLFGPKCQTLFERLTVLKGFYVQL